MTHLNVYRKSNVSFSDVCRQFRGTIKDCIVLVFSTKSFYVVEVDSLPCLAAMSMLCT